MLRFACESCMHVTDLRRPQRSSCSCFDTMPSGRKGTARYRRVYDYSHSRMHKDTDPDCH